MASLEDRIRELPPELRRQVEEFLDSLLSGSRHKNGEPLKFEWASALSDLKDRYTSVDLQRQIARWRSGDE